MVTVEYIFALIGSLIFKSAISASISYEPIKITVNENFNAQPGQLSTEMQALEPSVLHQGANFYFKPQLNLPQSFIPSHVEALISLIQQHHHSCAKDASKVVVEKDKLIEILQPFLYPLSEISKETLMENVLEKENNLEIVKPSQIIENNVTETRPVITTEEPKRVTPELLIIPEAPVLPPFSFNDIPAFIEKEVKQEDSVILEEPTGEFSTIPEIVMRPIMKPVINYVEPKLMPSELVNIPEASVLPSLSLNGITPNVEEGIKKDETVIVEGQEEWFPTISEIAVRPIQDSIINYVESESNPSELLVIPEAPKLPPLSTNDIKLIEDGVKFNKPTVVDDESKPRVQEHLVIPEAPVLPRLAIHDIPSIVKEDVKKEESMKFEEATGEISTIPEIAVRPITEPIINYVEPKVIASELANIPEAPVLPSLSYKGIPANIEEEIKKEETIIAEGQKGGFPTIPEIAVTPIQEPIINYVEPKPINIELEVISEAPVLPPLSANDIHVVEEVKIEEPIIVDVEPKPIIQELVIPEAPILPSLLLKNNPSLFEEKVKKEELTIFAKPMGVFPTITEIVERPINEPIINYVEPKHMASEFVNIPEAPVLPSFSNGIPNNVEEEIKKGETVIVEGQRGVFPTIPEIAVTPIQETKINYVEPKPIYIELEVIPEAPVLPPLSANDLKMIEDGVKINEPIVAGVGSKPAIQEYVIIPEAPVLPSLTLHDIPSLVEEEVQKEKPVIFKEPTGDFSTIPEIAVRPIQEPIINYVKPEPTTSDFPVIPEAPVLPPHSANDAYAVEEVKIEEPIIVDVEPKHIIQELVIQEASILPSQSLKSIPSFFEEKLKKEESIILAEPMGVFFTIPEIAERPIQKSIINHVEDKPVITELQAIPEVRVLPSLSVNDIRPTEGGVQIEESVVVDIESKPAIQELAVIPEAPVLPPLSRHDFPSIIEQEVNKEESATFEKSTGWSSRISKVSVDPIPEPIINYDEPKSAVSKHGFIPEAPVLPPLLAKDIHVIEEEVRIEEPVIIDEPRPFISNHIVIPEAPVIPDLSNNTKLTIGEEVTLDESIKVEESTNVLPSIPKISSRPIPKPIVVSETAESFALENNIFPVGTEEVKIDIPILLEETIVLGAPIAEISSGVTLETIQEPEMTNSYVLEEDSQPNPEGVVTVKKTSPPRTIPKPSNNLGVFSYAPFVSHISNRTPKTNRLTIAKPASLERFLLEKHPFRLPVTPSQNL